MKARGFLILNYVTLASVASTIITPALPHLEHSFSLSRSQVDWLMTLFLIGFALGQLFYGPLANKTSRVTSLRVGIGIHLFGLVLSILSLLIHNYPLLLFSRFLAAFGGASGLVCAFVLINETFTENEAKTLIPYIGLFFSVSVVISIFIGGFLTLYLGLIYCFVFNLLHALTLLFFTRRIQEKLQNSPHQLSPTRSEFQWLSLDFRRVIGLSIAASLLATFTYTYSTSIPLFAEKVIGLNEAKYGIWNLLNLIGMFISAYTTGKCCIKYGTVKTGFVGYFGFIVGLVGMYLYFILDLRSPLILFLITSYLYMSGAAASACAAYFASNALKDRALAASLLNFIALFLGGVSVFVLSYLPFKELLDFLITATLFFSLAFTFFALTKKDQKIAS